VVLQSRNTCNAIHTLYLSISSESIILLLDMQLMLLLGSLDIRLIVLLLLLLFVCYWDLLRVHFIKNSLYLGLFYIDLIY